MRFEGLDVSKIESEISSGVATNFEEVYKDHLRLHDDHQFTLK